MDIECKHRTSGIEYAGRISQTRGGLECQSWSSQYPHQHDFQVYSDNFENKSLSVSNFIRKTESSGIVFYMQKLSAHRHRFTLRSVCQKPDGKQTKDINQNHELISMIDKDYKPGQKTINRNQSQ